MKRIILKALCLLVITPNILLANIIESVTSPNEQTAKDAVVRAINLIKQEGFKVPLGNGCNGYHLIAFLDSKTLDALWTDWYKNLHLSLASESSPFDSFDSPNEIIEESQLTIPRQGMPITIKPAFNADTPLSIAMFLGHNKQADLFLKYGANVTYINGTGNAPFHFAPFADKEIFEYVLRSVQSKGQLNEYINMTSKSKTTILHNAAKSGNEYAYNKLISLGASNEITDLGGKLPKHYLETQVALNE